MSYCDTLPWPGGELGRFLHIAIHQTLSGQESSGTPASHTVFFIQAAPANPPPHFTECKSVRWSFNRRIGDVDISGGGGVFAGGSKQVGRRSINQFYLGVSESCFWDSDQESAYIMK